MLVWEDGQLDAAALARLRSDYPGLEVQEPLILPRQTFVARGTLQPVRVHVAFVPPRPAEVCELYALPTASPSISTFRSGPARPAITR